MEGVEDGRRGGMMERGGRRGGEVERSRGGEERTEE